MKLADAFPAATATLGRTAASSYTGKFIHIEQNPNVRNATEWIAPVEDAWPVGLPAATSGGPYATIAFGVASTSYLDTGVVNGVTYFWVVTAVNGVGESGDSAQVSAAPRAPTLPAAPTGLTATAGERARRRSSGSPEPRPPQRLPARLRAVGRLSTPARDQSWRRLQSAPTCI